MSFIGKWFDTYKKVLTQPSEFFESEDKRDGFGFSLKFAAVNLLIAGLLSSLSIVAFGSMGAMLGETSNTLGIGLLAAIALVATPIVGLIGLMISSGLIHIFVALLGGENGYSETLSVMGYATAIQPITAAFSFIPILGSLVNLAVGLYAVFIQAKGLENFQEMSLGRAIAAVLLPVLVIIAIVVAIVFVVVAGALAGISAG